MSLIINPGSGDASAYTEDPPTLANAWAAMGAFARDVQEAHGVTVEQILIGADGEGGRWPFSMWMADGREIEVDMPGLPIERVRWVGGEDQNIWDFPRLYVDGSSWVWKFAVNQCQRFDDEDDE